MVVTIVEKYLRCDGCGNELVHPDNHQFEHWRGETVYEGNEAHLVEVGAMYGWEGHLCMDCK